MIDDTDNSVILFFRGAASSTGFQFSKLAVKLED